MAIGKATAEVTNPTTLTEQNKTDLRTTLEVPKESDLFPITTETNVITFERERTFGTFDNPRTGTITQDLTGAKRIIQKMYYQNADELLPSNFERIGGEFVPNELNIYYFEYVGGGSVEYWSTAPSEL